MFATKETAVLVFFASVAACLAARYRFRPVDLGFWDCGVLTAALLLRSHSGEALRSLVIYAARAGSGGRHIHPWHYYLGALTPAGDAFWLLAGAVAFALLARRHRVFVFLGTYAAVLTVLYSVLPYKTPWCAGGDDTCLDSRGRGRRPSAALQSRWRAVALAGSRAGNGCNRGTGGSLQLSARRPIRATPTRTRTPLATSSRFATVFRRPPSAQPSGYATQIDLFANENWWPLPWYLRRFPNARWWSAPPRQGRVGPLVLCSPANEDALARLLYEAPPPGERELFVNLFSRPVWLRPGVEVRGYVAASVAPR